MFSTNQNRLEWTFRILFIGILGTLMLASKVWLTDRSFPVVPIIEGIPAIPSPLDFMVYCVLIVLCIYQTVSLENAATKKFLVGIFVLLLLTDQMRWQPFNVHYLLMLIGLLFFPINSEQITNVFRLFIITFLVWSGIQELNEVFAEKVYPLVLSKSFAEKFPSKFEGYITGSGYIFASLQLFSGIGLLFNKTRNYAVFVAIFTHLFLLYAADPFGNEVNRVMPLYNLISALLCFVLFYEASFQPMDILWNKKFRYHQIATIFYLVLPILSLFGIYDRMQSFNMYSGKGWYAKIYVSESLVQKLPEGMKRYIERPFNSMPYIETTYWANKELKVSPYSEKRVYNRLYNYVCSFAEGDCNARIEFYTW